MGSKEAVTCGPHCSLSHQFCVWEPQKQSERRGDVKAWPVTHGQPKPTRTVTGEVKINTSKSLRKLKGKVQHRPTVITAQTRREHDAHPGPRLYSKDRSLPVNIATKGL